MEGTTFVKSLEVSCVGSASCDNQLTSNENPTLLNECSTYVETGEDILMPAQSVLFPKYYEKKSAPLGKLTMDLVNSVAPSVAKCKINRRTNAPPRVATIVECAEYSASIKAEKKKKYEERQRSFYACKNVGLVIVGEVTVLRGKKTILCPECGASCYDVTMAKDGKEVSIGTHPKPRLDESIFGKKSPSLALTTPSPVADLVARVGNDVQVCNTKDYDGIIPETKADSPFIDTIASGPSVPYPDVAERKTPVSPVIVPISPAPTSIHHPVINSPVIEPPPPAFAAVVAPDELVLDGCRVSAEDVTAIWCKETGCAADYSALKFQHIVQRYAGDRRLLTNRNVVECKQSFHAYQISGTMTTSLNWVMFLAGLVGFLLSAAFMAVPIHDFSFFDMRRMYNEIAFTLHRTANYLTFFIPRIKPAFNFIEYVHASIGMDPMHFLIILGTVLLAKTLLHLHPSRNGFKYPHWKYFLYCMTYGAIGSCMHQVVSTIASIHHTYTSINSASWSLLRYGVSYLNQIGLRSTAQFVSSTVGVSFVKDNFVVQSATPLLYFTFLIFILHQIARYFRPSRIVAIPFIPHIVSSVLSEYDRGTNPSVALATMRMKIRRLASFPLPDRDCLAYIHGCELVCNHLLDTRSYFWEGAAAFR